MRNPVFPTTGETSPDATDSTTQFQVYCIGYPRAASGFHLEMETTRPNSLARKPPVKSG